MHDPTAMRRYEPKDGPDFFPTPPWAVRALVHHVLAEAGPMEFALPSERRNMTVWEPACGSGHMAKTLAEDFGRVVASDLYLHPMLPRFKPDFHANFLESTELPEPVDMIITNPPFHTAEEFTLHSLLLKPRVGVAMFGRLSWIESTRRYKRLFNPHPPSIIAPFAQRVQFWKGEVSKKSGTAVAFAWFIWFADAGPTTRMTIVPPCRDSLTRPEDFDKTEANEMSMANLTAAKNVKTTSFTHRARTLAPSWLTTPPLPRQGDLLQLRRLLP